MKNILYITYDSFNEPISESQVKPLLKSLSNNYNVFLISFEKNIIKEKNRNIKFWKKFKFRSTKLSKLKEIIKCLIFTIYIVKYYKIKIIHCRSYIPGIIAYFVKKILGVKYIFDIRGFWFDEKKDANLIGNFLFKLLKIFEKRIYQDADYVVTLSQKSINHITKKFLVKKSLIQKVTCFVDTIKFNKSRYKLSQKKITFGYIGNVGLSYDFQKVLNFFILFNKLNPNWSLLFANNYLSKKKKIDLFRNFPHKKKVLFYEAKYKQIPNIYSKFKYGIYFLKTDYSKIASCPTKLGEMLASGIPIVTGGNIGDIEHYIDAKDKCGYILNNLTIKNIIKLNHLLLSKKKYSIMRKNAIKIADKYFEKSKNIQIYENIYKKLI